MEEETVIVSKSCHNCLHHDYELGKSWVQREQLERQIAQLRCLRCGQAWELQ